MKKLILGTLALLAAGTRPMLASEVQTLPPAIYSQMKSGSKLLKVWTSPDYDGAKGLTIGKISADPGILDTHANCVDYFPYALRRLAIPDSTNILSMTMTALTTVDHGSVGYFSATMSVEGQIVDKDGKLVMAFATREMSDIRETVEANCSLVMDKIIWSLSRDLGKPFLRALELRKEVAEGVNPSGLVPKAPQAPEPPMDIKARLLRLEDLKQKGLITADEYKTHKEEILKGL